VKNVTAQHQALSTRSPVSVDESGTVAGHDADLEDVFAALHALIQPPRPPRRQIGFGGKVQSDAALK
jgi:hypothetical protein